MSSRQEEKEKRKAEREARERAAAQAAKRKRLLSILGGVAIAAVVVVAVVLAIAGGGGDDAKPNTGELKALAKDAGCVSRSFREESRDHVRRRLTADDYDTNPPTSGPHVPPGQEAQPGVYAIGNEPEIGNWVHTLEHGRILFQYKPNTPPGTIAELQNLFNEPVEDRLFEEVAEAGYHSVLMQNNSKMPFAVAAVAWRNYVGCPEYNDKTIAALRAFRDVYVDQTHEKVP